MKINLKNTVLRGTIILTAAGIISRIIGFFYRIYITRLIGSEGMGIYQLIMPLAGVIYAICVAGISTAISKFTAEQVKSGKWTIAGMILSIPLSIISTLIFWNYSDIIASRILLNSSCSPMLKMLSLSFPFASIHNCIAGYYFGKKKVLIPAISQLFEQLVRIGAVVAISTYYTNLNQPITVTMIIIGTVIGDIAATIFNIVAIKFDKDFTLDKKNKYWPQIKAINSYSMPLTLNRVLMHLLQSGEAVLIPAQLIIYGCSQSESLSLYGVLAGMALPFISFPSAITNSLSVMLLPEISNAGSTENRNKITHIIRRTIKLCLYMGLFFTFVFITVGPALSHLMFKDDTVGTFVSILAWLCPFQYLSVTLGSILNGLGKTTSTSIANIAGILSRIMFLIILTPQIGIRGYLYGILVGQILVCAAHIIQLNFMYHFTRKISKALKK